MNPRRRSPTCYTKYVAEKLKAPPFPSRAWDAAVLQELVSALNRSAKQSAAQQIPPNPLSEAERARRRKLIEADEQRYRT